MLKGFETKGTSKYEVETRKDFRIRIKNAKFSRYDFQMDPNIQGDFQICISVSLRNNTKLQKILS